MLNMNSLWPQSPANGAGSGSAAPTDPWGLGSVLETQARLWNHMLDANRSLWEVYLPWFASGPSVFISPFLAPQALAEAQAEPSPAPADAGVSQVLEAQAQTWNQWVDASRNFWGAFGWPAAGLGGNGAAPFARAASDTADAATRPAPRKAPRATRPPR